jgi:hypothetical protein
MKAMIGFVVFLAVLGALITYQSHLKPWTSWVTELVPKSESEPDRFSDTMDKVESALSRMRDFLDE